MTSPAFSNANPPSAGSTGQGKQPTVVNNPPPPANPKIAAVDFALRLAVVRATHVPQQETSVQQLVSDAAAIAAFMGR